MYNTDEFIIQLDIYLFHLSIKHFLRQSQSHFPFVYVPHTHTYTHYFRLSHRQKNEYSHKSECYKTKSTYTSNNDSSKQLTTSDRIDCLLVLSL